MKHKISDKTKQKVIFLFKEDYDKRLQNIADEVGISLTSVSTITDNYFKEKTKGNICFSQELEKEKFIILESKMNYDRD
jgi:hypothetical protein